MLKMINIINISALFQNIIKQLVIMDGELGSFKTDIEKFKSIQMMLPSEMKFKLEFMLGKITGKGDSLENLTQEERRNIEDMLEVPIGSLKIIFRSLVNSILDPKLYSSFEKQCKIKVYDSHWLKQKYQWKWVYIEFHEDSLIFKKRKGAFKFILNNLEVKPEESHHNQSRNKIKIIYNNKTKALLKFQNQASADNFVTRVKYLLGKNQKEIQSNLGKEESVALTMVEFKRDKNYMRMSEHKNGVFFCHRKQPIVYCELFLKVTDFQVRELITLLLTHKLWNSKLKKEEIAMESQLFQNSDIIIERKYQALSMFNTDRVCYTKARIIDGNGEIGDTLKKFHIINQNPKYIIIEEDISDLKFDDSKKKKLIIRASLNINIVVETLTQHFYKISLYANYNGKGNYTESESRKSIIAMFSDIMFLGQTVKKIIKKKCLKNESQLESSVQSKIYDISKNSSKVKMEEQQQKVEIEERFEISYNEEERDNEEQNELFVTIQGDDNFNRDDKFFGIDGWQSGQEDLEQSQSNNYGDHQNENQQNKNQQISGVKYSQNGKTKHLKQKQPLENFPKNAESAISTDYIKLLKERYYQRYYLSDYFNQSPIAQFFSKPPWYCPEFMISSGKEYKVNQKKELVYINQRLLDSQKDSLIYIIKQVGANIIKGKSIINVSLPVDIFEGRSLLERSASGFGCAPIFLKGIGEANIMTQMHNVVKFLTSVSPLELIMQKPFNPILGETFQCYLGGIPIYYEQISHHPPISAYYMKHEDFTLFGNLNAVANVGLNSANGGNIGVMNILFRNGSHFRLYMPPVEISGLVYGDRKFRVLQRAYVIEKNQRLIAEISAMKDCKGLYETKQSLLPGDIIGGIFQISEKCLDSLDLSCMKQFQGLRPKDVLKKLSHLSGVWYEDLFIDGENATKGIKAYPVEYPLICLPSNSNFRLDVIYHRFGDLARSQSEKQILQNLQRKDKKLRENYKKSSKT